jgi:dTDP-4-dehydrorhamnose reductase
VRIFITGHRGQLSQALQARLHEHTLKGGDLPDWDMLDFNQVKQSLSNFQPDVVLHTAALTNVDYCAEHPDDAIRVNGVGTYHIALACREVGATLVAISTNEVFDGENDRPYTEYDLRNPINPYGHSKFVAEQVIERFAPRYMIVRTAWMIAPGGVNFVHKIIKRAREGQPLRVVTDEIGNPTYAPDLADGIARLINLDQPGIFHLTNTGYCSRFELAQAVLKYAGYEDIPIEPITHDDFSRPSTPPLFSPLANMFAAAGGITLRPWEEAVAEYVTTYEAGT